MKILVVSWYFPPVNTMGALRIGKLVKHLLARGHDVRVVCAKDQPYNMDLPVEVPKSRIHYTPWLDVNGFPKFVQKLRVGLGLARNHRKSRQPATSDGSATAVGAQTPADPENRGLLRRLRILYTGILNCPDPQVGWFPYALREAGRVLRGWRPDVMYVSAPPHTALVVGHRLHRKYGIPWIAEYRDRWIEDPYGALSGWRQRLDSWIEDRCIRTASALVTVSEPWAEDYRRRWGKPVTVVYNGFDPIDFPAECERRDPDPKILRVVYTGILYPDRRDPSPLFEALSLLGDQAKYVRVEFYGDSADQIAALCARFPVQEFVRIHDAVPYAEAIRIQMSADILLLLQWNDPKERGNVPGKLFEYLGARRPVLGIGPEDGVPAHLLADRDAGVVVNDPAAIAEKLSGWIAEKRNAGCIALLPVSVRDGLSRPQQFDSLEALFRTVAGGASTSDPRPSEADRQGPVREAVELESVAHSNSLEHS